MSPEDSTLLFDFPRRGELSWRAIGSRQSSPRRILSGKPRRRELKRFLANVAAHVIQGRAVTCLITNDREMQRLNRAFRGKNHTTDVLSFPSGDSNHFAGDIAISLDRAVEQAAERGHGIEEEICILILHGVLHLSGLDHESDTGEMAKAEKMWRRRLGLPSGLIERTHRAPRTAEPARSAPPRSAAAVRRART